MNRGIHTKPNNGLSNDWITPEWVIKALGPFDLDPCASAVQPWRTARRMISPPNDGLAKRWRGRVWMNSPYGQKLKMWIERLADHGNGIALVPGRTEVESWFWPFIWERATAILFFRGRLYFHRPDGARLGNAGHGSVLAIYGTHNRRTVDEALINGTIRGRLIELDE